VAFPRRRQGLEERVELDTFHVPLEDERSRRVVLAELRYTGEEHEIEPTDRIRHDQAGIEGQVHVGVPFVSGAPQLPERSNASPVGAVLGDDRASFGLADEHGRSRVFDRRDPVEHEVFQDDASHRAAFEEESPETRARCEKPLDARCSVGCVSYHERAIGSEVERGRIEHATRLGPDLDELPRRLEARRDHIHGVRASVEDEVFTVWRLVAGRDLLEGSGEMHRQRRDRLEDLDVDDSGCRRRANVVIC
jgi:hypothetical protein